MSFIQYGDNREQSSNLLPPSTLSERNNPIFLIPGIVGSGHEMSELAKSLDETYSGNRRIFIHHDPRLTGSYDPQENIHKSFTLARHAKLIAKDLFDKRPKSELPYLIVGYSYGCILATEIALYLRTKGLDACVYLIDGPSAKCASQYLNSQSRHAVSDLISILSYTARIANLTGIDQVNNPHDQSLKHQPFEKRFKNIRKTILNSPENGEASPDEKENFISLTDIVKTNLLNIMSIEAPNEVKLNQLNAIFTSNTAEKYKSVNGGWHNYADVVELATEKELLNKHHTELLNASNAKKLAGVIDEAFKVEIIPERLQKNAEYLQEYKQLKSELERKLLSKKKPVLANKDDQKYLDPDQTTPYLSQVSNYKKFSLRSTFAFWRKTPDPATQSPPIINQRQHCPNKTK